jgi:hypothetical protein
LITNLRIQPIFATIYIHVLTRVENVRNKSKIIITKYITVKSLKFVVSDFSGSMKSRIFVDSCGSESVRVLSFVYKCIAVRDPIIKIGGLGSH